MNPANILALVSDLYGQVAMLTEENQRLHAAMEQSKNSAQS